MSERSLSATTLVLVALALLGVVFPRQSQSLVLSILPTAEHPDVDADGNPAASSDDLAKYTSLLSLNKRLRDDGFELLDRQWQPTDPAMLLQIMEFMGQNSRQSRGYELLRQKSGHDAPAKLEDWYDWLWQTRPPVDPRLRVLKCRLYGTFTPQFTDYFDDDLPNLIAYDEIRFARLLPTHVRVLPDPAWILPTEADYLRDNDVVFAIELNDHARAYPQKVISRYHVSTDVFAGEPYVCIYNGQVPTVDCFKTQCGGVARRLTASCFLHRTATLLCDEETRSLWSVESGQPVVGPLVGKGLQLERIPVSIGTWAAWRPKHPQGQVLADSHPPEAKDSDDE